MVQYFGDFAEDDTVLIPFNTFDSNDPSASVTITNLADADIMVHKDGGLTQIATDGATVVIDFDSITGNHLVTIDTSAHADYSTGSEYAVRIEGTTVDGATINAWIGSFSIERAGGALALIKAGNLSANVEQWLGTAAATPSVAGVPEVDLTHLGGSNQSQIDLKDFADAGYDPATNKVQGVVLTDTVTTLTNKTGFSLASTGLDAIVSTATGMVEIAKAVWDRIISKANHDIGQSAGKIVRISGDLVQIDGAVSDASPSVTGFDTNLTQADDFFNDAVLIFSNGAANAGIGKPVSTYLNANGAVTFLAPDDWPVTPVNGDDFTIFANHVHPIAQIADGVLDEALSGHTTAGTLGKAITDIEADTNELQTDWANGGRLDLILDAGSLKIQLTEGYAADGVAPTAEQLLFLVQQSIHEFAINGATRTVKKLDGSTTAATFTLDDSVNPTSTTRAT